MTEFDLFSIQRAPDTLIWACLDDDALELELITEPVRWLGFANDSYGDAPRVITYLSPDILPAYEWEVSTSHPFDQENGSCKCSEDCGELGYWDVGVRQQAEELARREGLRRSWLRSLDTRRRLVVNA